MTATELDLQLPSGRVHAQRWGDDGPLVLCVHGLSAHMHSFDLIGPALAAGGRQVVAVDLRGRARSEDTGPGTYGMDSHARDVLAIADALAAERFDHVGWSMGALIGILVADLAPGRLRRLALIDHAGRMDAAAVAAVEAGLARLAADVGDPEDYLAAIRAVGVIHPWTSFWDAFYRYELAQAGGRWRPTTSREACLEDLDLDRVEGVRSAWRALTMPTCLVRCTQPIAGGLIVPDEEAAAFRAAVPGLEVVDVDANHYKVMEDERTIAALREFLDRDEPAAAPPGGGG